MLEEEAKNNIVEEDNIENNPPFKSMPGLKDWIYRLLIFLIGIIGLELVGFIIQLILAAINLDYVTKDSPIFIQGLTIINSVRYIFIFIAIVAFLFPRIKYLLSRFKNWKHILIGLGFGIIVAALSELYFRVIGNFMVIEDNVNEEYAQKMIAAYPVISVISLGIIGPIVEEFTYRYGLFECLKKKNKILAYIVTVLVFAFIHFNFDANIVNELLNIPAYLMSGLIITIAYDKFGLEASIAAHVFNNMLVIILSIIGL